MIQSFDGFLPQLAGDHYVAEQASLIGRIVAGSELTVFPNAVLRGDLGEIKLGHRVSIQELVSIHCEKEGSRCEIGDDSFIGRGALLFQCTIGKGVRIGEGCHIMPDVVIGDQAIITPGTIIARGTEIAAQQWVQGIRGQVIKPVPPKILDRGKNCSAESRKLARKYQVIRSPELPKPGQFVSR